MTDTPAVRTAYIWATLARFDGAADDIYYTRSKAVSEEQIS